MAREINITLKAWQLIVSVAASTAAILIFHYTALGNLEDKIEKHGQQEAQVRDTTIKERAFSKDRGEIMEKKIDRIEANTDWLVKTFSRTLPRGNP